MIGAIETAWRLFGWMGVLLLLWGVWQAFMFCAEAVIEFIRLVEERGDE